MLFITGINEDNGALLEMRVVKKLRRLVAVNQLQSLLLHRAASDGGEARTVAFVPVAVSGRLSPAPARIASLVPVGK